MIVVSLVIGMGIFRSSFNVAKDAGSPAIFFIAWLVGGMIALFGALTFAEIGSRYPVTGGFYKIYSYCYHPALAFMINGIILISNAASVSAVALIGAGYLRGMLPANYRTEAVVQMVALGAVIVFFFVNYLGFKMSVKTQNVLMVLKIVIVLFICAGLFFPANPVAPVQQVAGSTGFWEQVKALGAALIAVSFTYGGYQQTINFGGEIRDAGRTTPRGIGIGIAIIISLYLALNFVYVRVIGFHDLQTADSIAAQLMGHLFGPAGDTLLRCLMFLSVLAYVNVSVMSNPRVMFAMSDEKILPAVFKKTTPRHGVIIWSLTAFSSAIVLTLLFTSAVEKLIDYTIFLDSIAFAFSAGSLFILRRRRIGEDRDIYRMKGFPFIPAFFILAYLSITISVAISDPESALYCVYIFLIFFILFFILRWINRSKGDASGIPAEGQSLE